LDKALVSAGSRLDKSLRFIKSYRVGFADDVRRQTDRLLMADVTSPAVGRLKWQANAKLQRTAATPRKVPVLARPPVRTVQATTLIATGFFQGVREQQWPRRRKRLLAKSPNLRRDRA
jgi:hypothetical protein